MHSKKSFFVYLLSIVFISLFAVSCGGGAPTTPAQESTKPTVASVIETNAPAGEVDIPTATNTIIPTATATEIPPTPTNTSVPPSPTAAPIGMSRSNPYPMTELVSAPNWNIQVLEVVRGNDAWNMIQSANMFNDPAPDGMEYVLVKISAESTYTDSDEHSIGTSDFDLTGDKLIRYSTASVVEPDPELDGQLYAGGKTEGWAAFSVSKGESNLILIYDELFNFEKDRYRYIALDEGASISIPEELTGITPNELGLTRQNPASSSDIVITDNWQISVNQVVRGDEAWSMAQDANQFNDQPADGMEYIAVNITAKNLSRDDEATNIDGNFFKTTGSANILYSLPFVVDPEPTLDAYLYPGGEYSGWVVLQVQKGETDVMLVFEPTFSFSDDELRFIALEDNASVEIPSDLTGINPNDSGTDHSNPAQINDDIILDDWEFVVLEAIRGDNAWSMVQDANQFNDPPDDGMEYIAVKVRARNISTDDKPANISGSFFNTTGDNNVSYDLPIVVDPEPTLDAYLFPGGQFEGWVVVQAGVGESNILLVFEPPFSFDSNNKRFVKITQ
jgi:hypothetical protein